MWLQKWSPDIKPEEDLPIALAWVLLLGLPFHLHNWHYISQIVKLIGTPMCLDASTTSRTRPSMAKVRVEVNLLKTLPESIYIGIVQDKDPQTGFDQKVEYEGIPKYCRHCKKLGHYMMECRVLERKNMRKDASIMTQNNNSEENKEAKQKDGQKSEQEGNQQKENVAGVNKKVNQGNSLNTRAEKENNHINEA
ncbi:uncharacterized protein LOC132620049 [Lycium barbarum]|uniref:uncharacterized protein LOC132620049 n=1 Tax=Lycium barbarum TaxID=112863 RepID=UPI00293EBFCF|nr:uncharacterized protein LOC132620049 [Lycium barbarum]